MAKLCTACENTENSPDVSENTEPLGWRCVWAARSRWRARRGAVNRRSGALAPLALHMAMTRGTDRLVEAARLARDHAVADFSGFRVGAALETGDGTIVSGCNIENATYGLTLCAERVAMFKALSDGHRTFRAVAVVADTEAPTPPCGACRQILWEFAGDIEVTLANLHQIVASHRLSSLLPLPFDKRLLK